MVVHAVMMQIRDLNSGTFGFVQLARDKQTGELIAVKFIERGDKVSIQTLQMLSKLVCCAPSPCREPRTFGKPEWRGTDTSVAAGHQICRKRNHKPSMLSTPAYCTI